MWRGMPKRGMPGDGANLVIDSNGDESKNARGPARHARRRVGGALAVVGIAAISLAACSSNNSGSGTTATTAPQSQTTATTAAGASLSGLEAKAPTSSVSLQETGSSLLYPLFNLWVQAAKSKFPSISVTTASTGSGTGVSSAATGTVQIGASDAYLSSTQVTQYPGIMNIPLAISSQFVAYNVPNLTGHLKLSGMVLSQIYQGKITNWNASQIASLNPGVTLPNLPIVTVHRSDSSGDTFLFTSFLSDADPSGWGAKYSYNTSDIFPSIPGAEGADKNSGMLSTCEATKGCIAYIGVSYLSKALSGGLGEAELQNKSGNFELPTPSAISAEADSFTSATPASGTISMIFGSVSDGYPIVNYEYAIVLQKQSSSQDAAAIQALLAWVIDPSGGSANSFLSQVGFVPLPSQVVNIAVNQLSKIS
jgi:phosphate transport system substrate-binding protein